MKNNLLFLFALLASGALCSQNVPIANDDYALSGLGDTITINVVANDTHPDGISFKVRSAPNSLIFTDSTVTYYFDYDSYYNITDTLRFGYILMDENGLAGPESQGIVFIEINNSGYINYLDINNIRAQIQASGQQFWPEPISNGLNDPVFEFPKGSGLNTIFNSTLWIGGLDESDSLRLAAERYRQSGLDYWTGPLSSDGTGLSIDLSTVVQYQKVWKLTGEELLYHKNHYSDAGYVMINDIATWPAHGDTGLNQAENLAPFVDTDGDNLYNPMAGDYPLIRGDQCIYFIVNDLRNHTESGGEALGLEIHGMAYEFYYDESISMNNAVFFSYKIINRSSNTYHDTYVGLFTDFDLGFAGDDYVGCDVARGTYYGYNGDSIDGEGGAGTYGDNVPAQGIVILGGPFLDANSLDDPDNQCDESINGVDFGDGIADNERYGMKKFIYFNNTSQAQGDPQNAEDYYNYLNSIWRDGTTMEYGGSGHINSGAYGPSANFMYPGLTDPCFWGTSGVEPFGPVDWTEVTVNNVPGDRRGLSVMGPFTFEPETTEMIDVAYVAAFHADNETAVETLMTYVDEVKTEYYKNPTYFGYQWLGVDENTPVNDKNKILIYPNPVSNTLTFTYSGQSENAVYKLTDIMGTTVMTDQLAGNESHTLDVSSLKPGMYVLTITGTNGMVATKVLKN